MELEKHTNKLWNQLKGIPSNMVITDNLTVGEVTKVLRENLNFIFHMKMELGEDITGDTDG